MIGVMVSQYQHRDDTKQVLVLSWFRSACVISKIVYTLLVPFIFSALPIQLANSASAIPIQLGEWYLEPTVDITYGQSESQFEGFSREESDTYLSIEPNIRLYNYNSDREIIFSFEGNRTRFNENPDSDNESAYFSGEYKKSLTDNSDISLKGEYEEGAQSQGIRGEIETVSVTEETRPEDYTIKSLMLKYDFYGVKNAGHNFSVSIEKEQLRYDDSIQSRSQLSDSQRDSTSLNAKWRYLWARDTGVFVNLKHTENDYLFASEVIGGELDNKETQLLFGLEWRVRKNIYGEFAAGVVKKKFDNIDVDVEIPAFYGRVEVLLTQRDTVRLDVKQEPVEQAGVGIFQDFREFDLSWVRSFTPRLSMEAYVGRGEVEYELDSRRDRFFRYGLLFDYRLNRTSDIILGFRGYEDDSSEDRFDYHGSNIFITYSKGL